MTNVRGRSDNHHLYAGVGPDIRPQDGPISLPNLIATERAQERTSDGVFGSTIIQNETTLLKLALHLLIFHFADLAFGVSAF